ncbi:MAG: uroporphyrinogen-III C-methyltransferase [Proteobacteria bacterium]|nr:uroporphyrinogen-III C-methyltransferase [Pseudomonadota bacterium]
MSGKVFLVGAGPGDPELITLKGKKYLEIADVVIYDYLANPELLKFSPKAEKIYVGKKSANHTLDQEKINELLIKKARENKVIVRLKGGDPFIFGRGGEEALALKKEGIEFEIVPGITSGLAGPLYAGIPITMRGINSTIAFATGHETDEKEFSLIDWDSLSKMGTIIFYMGVKNLPIIVENLVNAGKSKDTPIALIRWATYPNQEVLTGSLDNIVQKVRETGFKAPAIIVIGEVVHLREDLMWFEKKPLFGKTILVTRTKEQSGKLSSKLKDLGANVLEIPTIEIVPPESWEEVDRSINDIENYDLLILTSVNGVKYFFGRLRELKKDIRILKGIKICAIGPATRDAIEEKGLIVDIMPDEYVAESVIDRLREQGIAGKKFLLARAKVARDVIPESIKSLGGHIDVVTVYETIKPESSKNALREAFERDIVDIITFTSSSTVNNFFNLLGDIKLSKKVKFASIGPVTSKTLRDYGIEPSCEAKVYNIEGLINAIIDMVKKD